MKDGVGRLVGPDVLLVEGTWQVVEVVIELATVSGSLLSSSKGMS